MKLVTAVVKPFRLSDVVEALREIGVGGITITEAKGFGRQGGHTESYRGAEYRIDLVPKVELEILVDDGAVDSLVDTLAKAAITGKIGDGKIWVRPVDEVIRIRTDERGAAAV